MFSSASKTQSARRPNAYNAWSHHISKEASDDGGAPFLLDLQKENIDDCRGLTSEEKEFLIEELEEERESWMKGVRLSQRGRMQNVNNVCNKMDELLDGLKHRAGIQGFYCLFRSTPDFNMAPRWFFTTDDIDMYLRTTIKKGWDTDNIAEITGNRKAVMNYVNYEREIILCYGIKLVGWTADKWVNPSDLSNAIAPLQKLLKALEDGSCHFERMPPAELVEQQERYDQSMEAGLVTARKVRKNLGKKRMKGNELLEAEDSLGEDGAESSDRASKHP
ncbi:hypothetical protein A0H81_03870 [Grifola frondosa]|uniref:Uncharacterized protein n=1 Tax=Grifola frondosa TaxID=5627 RepID=A0A1C7MJ12_GRIFR|nr:hypothetical protein A0H81_03870 [Grifola frondosa]